MVRRTVRRLEGKDAQFSADLLRANYRGLFFTESAQFPGTPLYKSRGNFVGKRGGLRTGPLGEGEDMQISESMALDEGECGGVVLDRFTRESGDDVSSNGRVRQMFAD